MAPGDDTGSVYRRAKGRADTELVASGLDYTVVRPVRLTDEPGAGRVEIGGSVRRGEVSRDDVAAVLAATLHEPGTVGKTFELAFGDTPIDEALMSLA